MICSPSSFMICSVLSCGIMLQQRGFVDVYGLHRVFFEENAGVRKVFLNRPKKLNIINYKKVCQMLKKLEALVLVML